MRGTYGNAPVCVVDRLGGHGWRDECVLNPVRDATDQTLGNSTTLDKTHIINWFNRQIYKNTMFMTISFQLHPSSAGIPIGS